MGRVSSIPQKGCRLNDPCPSDDAIPRPLHQIAALSLSGSSHIYGPMPLEELAGRFHNLLLELTRWIEKDVGAAVCTSEPWMGQLQNFRYISEGTAEN